MIRAVADDEEEEVGEHHDKAAELLSGMLSRGNSDASGISIDAARRAAGGYGASAGQIARPTMRSECGDSEAGTLSVKSERL